MGVQINIKGVEKNSKIGKRGERLFGTQEYKVSKINPNESSWTLPIPENLSLYFILHCEILSLLLRTYNYRVCIKYWLKPKNYTDVDPEILSIKVKSSHFAPVSHSAPGYPKKIYSQILKSTSQKLIVNVH